jgi:hypothetical protein
MNGMAITSHQAASKEFGRQYYSVVIDRRSVGRAHKHQKHHTRKLKANQVKILIQYQTSTFYNLLAR